MDGLLTREIEVVFLERLSRDPGASAWTSVWLTEVDVLGALKRRLPHLRIGTDEVLAAAEASPALTCRAAPPSVVDGQLSWHTLQCHPRHLPGVTPTSVQADFSRLAREFNAAGHRPVAGLFQTELHLRDGEGTLAVRNSGYGTDDDILVTQVVCPGWLISAVNGRQVELRVNPAYNGCYRGPVTVQTNAGEVTCTVVSRHWCCPPVPADPVGWQALVTRHSHLDEEASVRVVEAHLTAIGYRALAGGFFALNGHAQGENTDRAGATSAWKITAEHLRLSRLPAQGHAPLVRLYSPEGTDHYDVHFDGEVLHGKALEELFLMWDVRAGRELLLTPYRGHYRFEVRRPDTWLNVEAAEYGVVGTLHALHRTPHFWAQLEEWLTTAPVHVLLHDREPGLFGEVGRRFPGRLTVRLSGEPVGTDRIYFTSAEGQVEARGLPEGQLLKGGTWPSALWEAAAPKPLVVPKPAAARPTPRVLVDSLEPYEVWVGTVAHPQERSTQVLQSVKEILRVEGPIVGWHLYDRYGQALAAQKGRAAMTSLALRRALNSILYHAAQRGELLTEDEFGTGGQVGLVYRLPGQAVRPRMKGDRSIDRIPRSELRAVVKRLPHRSDMPELEQIAWVLEQFGFGRFLEGGPRHIRPLLRELDCAAAVLPQRRRAR